VVPAISHSGVTDQPALSSAWGTTVVAVIQLIADVSVLADSDEADRIAKLVIDEELDRARDAIKERLVQLGVNVTLE
jgi:hypothetical protein